MKKPVQILSLGCGVQSSCIALMATKGELPHKIDAAIFSDVGAEPASVYSYLAYLQSELPFPLYVIKHLDGLTKGIEKKISGEADRLANPPFFTEQDGEKGILKRRCTGDYKIDPLKRKIRALLGYKKRQKIPNDACTMHIGISLDEIQRMTISRDKWINHSYPLVDLRMRRGDCLEWLKRAGYPEPPRSACVYCPYHSDHEWRNLKNRDSDGWREAVRVDKLIRAGLGQTNSRLFLHSSCKPLENVDLTTDEDRGQLTFLNSGVGVLECEGMCGV